MPPRLGALIAILLWGVSFVATKAVLRELSPITLVFLRFTLGLAALLVILALRRKRIVPERRLWPSLALMGFVGIFVHQMLQVHGLELTTAVHTGWLIGLIPIWSAMFAVVVLGERIGPVKIAGLILGFAGAVLVVTRGELSAAVLALPSTRGDLLVLASTVNWALYTVLGHPTIRALGPSRATAGAMFFGWLMLIPLFVLHQGWTEVPSLSNAGWGAVLFLGIGCSGLGYLFWYGALEKVEASRVAALLYLEPFITVAAAVMLLGEPVRFSTVAGGITVLAGVLLIQRAPSQPAAVRAKKS